jgi:anti-sigma B factor antagonist
MAQQGLKVVREENAASGLCVLRPTGELDLATVPRLETAVSEALESGGNRIVLDLSELSFLDSSGLRLLLMLFDRATSDGWTLTLARPSEPVRGLFEMTGVAERLPVVENWTPT